MPEEKDITITQKQETTEVLDTTGSTAEPSLLADVVNAMAEAKSQGRTAKEGIADYEKKSSETAKEPQKKADPEPVATKTPTEPEKAVKATEGAKETKPEETKTPEDDDPRAALLKAMDKKRDDKAKPAEETKATETEPELPEEDLQPSPHDKPKTVKRIKQLWGKVKQWETMAETTKRERDEKAAKLAELEKKLTEVKTVDPTTDEKIKAQLDELAMYRRRYELDNDPEVKTKFDDRISSAEDVILSTLKKRRASEGLLNIIKEEGGWEKFAASSRMMELPDGEGGVKSAPAMEVADLILQTLPLPERKAIEAAMVEQFQTRRDRERFYKEQQQKANEWFASRETESKKAQEAQAKMIEEATKHVEEWRKNLESSDLFKDRIVDDNATAQEKAAAKEYNEYNAQMRAYLGKAISAKDLNGLLEVVGDSVRYYAERRNSASLKAELEALKAENAKLKEDAAKFKRAGGSVPKQGSIAAAATPASSRADRLPSSLEEFADRVAQGERFPGGRPAEDE